MSTDTVKREFFLWINTLDRSLLSEVDRKLINLFITNFEMLFPLGTAKGARAKAIGQLITKNHEILLSDFPDLHSDCPGEIVGCDRIARLEIGPFRGFTTSESFVFDKKYTFIYGPNGSGKSSFCEGLEYALLGSIEEAGSKRIPLHEYVQNAQKSCSIPPKAYTLDSNNQMVEIPKNPVAYRFAFIEKNRIDAFARITAATQGAQKDRIATLFGLDAFSDWVDGFTDDFDSRYISLENQKEKEFNKQYQLNETSKSRIEQLEKELSVVALSAGALIKELANDEVVTFEGLGKFLVGEDGISGIINDLQQKRTAQIPEDLKTDAVDAFLKSLPVIRNSLEELAGNIIKIGALSTDVNFEKLYSAITSIAEDSGADQSVCPACKTPIGHVFVNPFENAITELERLKSLTELQKNISDLGRSLEKDVRSANDNIKQINVLGQNVSYQGPKIPEISEFEYTDIKALETWKPQLERDLDGIEAFSQGLKVIGTDVVSHNSSLQEKREAKNAVDEQLKKCQAFKSRYDEIVIKQKSLQDEKERLQKEIDTFQSVHKTALKEIEEEKQKIEINQKYVESYRKLIGALKSYRDQLPSKLAVGLSEMVQGYYNTINGHDPDFEMIDGLSLPTAPGQGIIICFQGDSCKHNALQILSEGHIRVLGLSILLAKAVKEDLGFLVFDDVVNAIDDDHRDGIAQLLLKHPDLKDRQHIVTCHGQMFINKLEHKLGASLAGKEVKAYRFFPADTSEERCVRVCIGDSNHYLLKAKESLDKNELKDAATHCRQALESISQLLWNKLAKTLRADLTVKMRSPSSNPDLSTVVDGLIKLIKPIDGLKDLRQELQVLKEKYPWSLLNKGTHEQSDLPEFERKDISDLLSLVWSIEEKVSALKLWT